MNERIHKYFYEELSTEERLSLLRDVEASEELKKEFVEYQNLYALLNLGHQVQDKTIGKQKYDCFIWLSGNIWLVSFKISYLCLPLFYETRTTPSCHPSGCAYRQL